MKIQRFDIHNFSNCEKQMRMALSKVTRTPEIEAKIDYAMTMMNQTNSEGTSTEKENELLPEARLFFEAIMYELITQEEFIAVMRTRNKLPVANIFMQ